MNEKGRTPNGMSEAGYQQALENVIYAVHQITRQVEQIPGEPLEKVMSLIGKGDVYQQVEHLVTKLDDIIAVIVDTYGYTEEEVEQHIEEKYNERLFDFMAASILEDLQK
jgi:hypothetical protein